MTHGELLEQISFKKNKSFYLRESLRAVVELHKPVMAFTGGYDGEENPLYAEQCNDCSSNGFSQEYPCQTIQAIEKELR